MPTAGSIIRASDVPRVVAIAVITANSADVESETVIATIGSASYTTGRAYRVIVKGLALSEVAGTASPRLIVRKGTTTAGTAVLESFRIATPVANDNFPVYLENFFTPDANFTDSFCLTLQRRGGAAGDTVRFAASATENTGFVRIEDMGAGSLSQYPGINGIS